MMMSRSNSNNNKMNTGKYINKNSITRRREVVRVAVEKENLCFQVQRHVSYQCQIPASVSLIILVSAVSVWKKDFFN